MMKLSGVDMFQGNFRLNHASGSFADPAQTGTHGLQHL
jgi:peptide/nickel transport system substrate-binding protein